MVDWDVLAPMMVAIVLILTAGGVAVLRPIAKRLSELAELYLRDRQSGLGSELQQLRDVLETTNARLQLLEERQDFMERLAPGPASPSEEARAEPRTRGAPHP